MSCCWADYVLLDSFTHGTSEQPYISFREGFDTGNVGRRKLLFNLDYNDL